MDASIRDDSVSDYFCSLDSEGHLLNFDETRCIELAEAFRKGSRYQIATQAAELRAVYCDGYNKGVCDSEKACRTCRHGRLLGLFQIRAVCIAAIHALLK